MLNYTKVSLPFPIRSAVWVDRVPFPYNLPTNVEYDYPHIYGFLCHIMVLILPFEIKRHKKERKRRLVRPLGGSQFSRFKKHLPSFEWLQQIARPLIDYRVKLSPLSLSNRWQCSVSKLMGWVDSSATWVSGDRRAIKEWLSRDRCT